MGSSSHARRRRRAGLVWGRGQPGLFSMRSLIATLFLASVASFTGVILRGPNVTSDTYIRAGSSSTAPIINYATTNFNAQTTGWWDGPLTISAANVISGVTSDTSALLIKFDLSSFVDATLVPGRPAWLNYYVSDEGNAGSLRELTVPWNEVCTPPAKTRTPLTTSCGTPWLRPLRADVPLCPCLLSTDNSHVDQPPIRIVIVELHQCRRRRIARCHPRCRHWLAEI